MRSAGDVKVSVLPARHAAQPQLFVAIQHQQIDRAIAAQLKGHPAQVASDWRQSASVTALISPRVLQDIVAG
jgi:hypothetical protein